MADWTKQLVPAVLAALMLFPPSLAAQQSDSDARARKQKRQKDEGGYYSGLNTSPYKPETPTSAPVAPSKQLKPPEEDPPAKHVFMWKAQKDGHTIYVVGDIDMLNENLWPLPTPIERAFRDSDCLFIRKSRKRSQSEGEAYTAKLVNWVFGDGMYPPGDDLSKHLSPETSKVFDDYLSWSGETMAMHEKHKPGFVGREIIDLHRSHAGIRHDLDLDDYFLEKAKLNHKKLIEYSRDDTEDDDLMATRSPSVVDDRVLMASCLRIKNLNAELQEQERAWRTADLAKMEDALMGFARGKPALKQFMLDLTGQRNEQALDGIEKQFAGFNTGFMAVGSWSVIGDRGLPALFQKRGYTVTQVNADNDAPRLRPMSTGPAHATLDASFESAAGPKLKPQFISDAPLVASLPGKPERGTAEISSIGRSVVGYVVEEGRHGMYILMYLELDRNLTDHLQEFYDQQEIAVAQAEHGTVKDGFVEYLGNSARQYEMRYHLKKNPRVERIRRMNMVLLGSRVYMVGCQGTPEWVASPQVARFMSSVRVTRNPDAPAPESASFHWATLSHVLPVPPSEAEGRTDSKPVKTAVPRVPPSKSPSKLIPAGRR